MPFGATLLVRYAGGFLSPALSPPPPPPPSVCVCFQVQELASVRYCLNNERLLR